MSFNQGAVLLHGTTAAIMAYGYNSLSGLPMNEWIKTQKGGHFQFLTILGLSVAWLTMVTGLASDLVPSFAAVKRIKRILLMTAMPLAVVVASIYWPLIMFFPKLIVQKDPNSEPSSSPEAVVFIPLDVDLSLHAVPALTLLFDFMFLEHKFSKKESRYLAPLIVLISAASYGSWVEYCAKFNGTFPYPFLTENSFEVRVGIYAGASAIALGSFWGLNALHSK